MLGFNRYKVEIVLNNLSKKKEIINYLSSQKNVTRVTEMIGREDINFDVDFKTSVELDNFLEKLRTGIPEIKDFEIKNIIVD